MVRSVKEALDSRNGLSEWEGKIDDAIDKQFAGMNSTVSVYFERIMPQGTIWAITEAYGEQGWEVTVKQPETDQRGEPCRGSITLKPKKV